MRHAGLRLFVLVVGVCCLAVIAEAQQTRSAVNANSKRRVASTGTSTLPQQPLAPPGYLDTPSSFAILGEVRKPGIYTSSQPQVTIQQLIQSAGGQTERSNGYLRIYENGRSFEMLPVERLLQQTVQNGQVVYIAAGVGNRARTLTLNEAPYRPIVLTGIAPEPLLLNISDRSTTVEQLILVLGQVPEILGADEFVAISPERGWLGPDHLLISNTIVHFPTEAVNLDGVRWALQHGLKFEPKMAINSGAPTPGAGPESPPPQAPPPVDVRPQSIPSAVPRQAPPVPPLPRQAPPVPAPKPVQTSDLVPDLLNPAIEPAGSSETSHEPLRLPRFEDEPEEVDSAPAVEEAPVESKGGRPPIMMRPEWSTFGADDEEFEEGRKIERTSAQRAPAQRDREIVLAAASTSQGESNPVTDTAKTVVPEATVPATSPKSSFNIESWMAIAVTLGVAALSVIVTYQLSGDVERVIAQPTAERRALPESEVVPQTTAVENPPSEDARFVQRLILNQVPLVEEEPTLPPVDRLHGVVIGSRRMIIHETHEGVAGPHFVVRSEGDTRPMERRLRTVMRESTSSTVVASSDSSRVRSATGPLERALRNMERGGQR